MADKPTISNEPKRNNPTDGWKYCTCGYDGHDGYMVSQVDEDPRDGHHIDAWFCPICGDMYCMCGVDCPPDEFGQVCD